MSKLSPVRVPNLQEVVIEQVKQYIIAAGLRAGDRLPPEEELAQQLGISRTVVREALRAMEALGIVTARQGSGRYVRDFTFDPILDNLAYSMLYDFHTFEELLQVREKLEAGFLAEVIAHLSPNTVQSLRKILERMKCKAAQGASTDELLEEDVAFHRALYENVNNSLLLKLLEIFWRVQKDLRARFPDEMKTPEKREQFVRRHEALVEALEQRDVELARERLHKHFEGVRQWILQQKRRSERG